jgi:hypothetical protein
MTMSIMDARFSRAVALGEMDDSAVTGERASNPRRK